MTIGFWDKVKATPPRGEMDVDTHGATLVCFEAKSSISENKASGEEPAPPTGELKLLH